MKTVLIFFATLAAAAALQHPTLPVNWKGTVNEMGVGTVWESYRMVDKPTPSNPSAKWTNYTDGSCQRLIWDGNNADQARYLLGCDAVDCCVESQSGNHVEYQIPNIGKPSLPTKFAYLGKHTIEQDQGGGKIVSINTDVYHWCGPKDTPAQAECFYAHTTGNTTGLATLRRWTVSLIGKNYTNDYYSYNAIASKDLPGFIGSFQVPEICRANNVLHCNEAFARGKLSAKNLAFVKNGLPKPKLPLTTYKLSPAFLASKGAAAASHYEDPSAGGCQAGEEGVRIQGVQGDFCSPSCASGPCPTDVPAGTTARPECALETPGSSKPSRCALICQASSKCPAKASCKMVQGAIGLCTYDS